VARARQSNFHIAMATVPSMRVGKHGRRATFPGEPRWLSLLIHGNNHTHEELAQPIPQQKRISLLAEALRRIDALEHKSGVNVLRIMVPRMVPVRKSLWQPCCTLDLKAAWQPQGHGCGGQTNPLKDLLR